LCYNKQESVEKGDFAMKKHEMCALIAALLWGLTGMFTRTLNQAGLVSMGVVLVRCLSATVLFAVTLLVKNPKGFRIKLKDAWVFFGSGIVSLLCFTFCYFQAIELMSLSTAAILLYTAPMFVMLISLPLFKEKITGMKVLCLILAFAGCVLVSGIGGTVNLKGILYGLGAGLGYALYSVFARLALDKGYSSNTVNFYSCLLASVGAGCIGGFAQPISLTFSNWSTLLPVVGIGFVCCYLPYLSYTFALTGCEPSRASIICTAEPVSATLVGIIVFQETLTAPAIIGIVLTVAAIVLLNLPQKGKE